MVIAVDAAGGDFYPANPVEGGILAMTEYPTLQIIFVGPEAMIREELAKHEYDKDRVHVQDAPEIIGMEESPSSAVKNKRNSSITIGLGMHKAGKCHAFVSAGNTGALLAASTFILGKLEGVSRPTIAAYFPTLKGFRLLVDAGANLELKPEMAVQFAKMAQVYSSAVMGISSPKVGLMNVGEEDEKGTETTKEIHAALKSVEGFVGNVEGRDVFPAKADIFITDGMVGNILLKFGESIPDALFKMVHSAFSQVQLEEKEMKSVQKVLKTALNPFNYENVGGLPFLGVNGVSIVGHGGSSAPAIKNMIKAAVDCIESDINGKIVASLN